MRIPWDDGLRTRPRITRQEFTAHSLTIIRGVEHDKYRLRSRGMTGLGGGEGFESENRYNI
jgi:hypothetical protein